MINYLHLSLDGAKVTIFVVKRYPAENHHGSPKIQAFNRTFSHLIQVVISKSLYILLVPFEKSQLAPCPAAGVGSPIHNWEIH